MLHGSKYFSASEFACKCGCGFGAKEGDVADDLVHALHVLRVRLAVPFKITSAARCLTHNSKVGGGVRSTHLSSVKGLCTPGYEGKVRAVDVDTNGWSITLRAEAVQCALAMGMRVGIHPAFLHFDVEGAPYYGEGLWNYGSQETSSGGS